MKVSILFLLWMFLKVCWRRYCPKSIGKSQTIGFRNHQSVASDRIGIIAYAGQAFPQLPITTDYGAAKMFLQSMNTDMLTSQGTAINEAIELASTYYDDEEQTNRVLFISRMGKTILKVTLDAVETAVEEGIQSLYNRSRKSKGAPFPLKETVC